MLTVWLVYLFLSFHFQTFCVFIVKVDFLYMEIIRACLFTGKSLLFNWSIWFVSTPLIPTPVPLQLCLLQSPAQQIPATWETGRSELCLLSLVRSLPCVGFFSLFCSRDIVCMIVLPTLCIVLLWSIEGLCYPSFSFYKKLSHRFCLFLSIIYFLIYSYNCCEGKSSTITVSCVEGEVPRQVTFQIKHNDKYTINCNMVESVILTTLVHSLWF